jgi:hypothetical protein
MLNAMVLLDSARLIDGDVEVTWRNQHAAARYPAFWLRDHCHAKESLNPDTLQRQVDTFSIPETIAASSLEILDGGRSLGIVWQHDGSRSTLPAVFLWNLAENDGYEAAPERRLWDRATIGERFPTMPYAAVMSGSEGLLRWLAMVEEYGFALCAPACRDDRGDQGIRDARRLRARNDIWRHVGLQREPRVQGHRLYISGDRSAHRRHLQQRFAGLPNVSLL